MILVILFFYLVILIWFRYFYNCKNFNLSINLLRIFSEETILFVFAYYGRVSTLMLTFII
jgi:hypothetical protein